MAEKPKEFLIEKLERSISPTAKTWQLSEGALKTFLPKKAFEEPMKRLPVEVKPPVEAEPKKPSTFWKTLGKIMVGALEAYALGPGEYLRLTHQRIERGKEREFEREMLKKKQSLLDVAAKLKRPETFEQMTEPQQIALLSKVLGAIKVHPITGKPISGYEEVFSYWQDLKKRMKKPSIPKGILPDVPAGRVPMGEREFSGMSLEKLEAERQKELSGR